MKAVLRGIVSMAFSTIEDQNTQHRVPLKPKTNPDVSRPSISAPLPVPADEIYKPLSSSDPVPFGAITKVESIGGTFSASNLESSLSSITKKEDEVRKEVKLEDLVPDNLTQIKGLDPIAIMGLKKKGIVTFLQIADLTDQEVADIEEDLDLPGCFNRFSWRYQSRQLHLDND
jgi:predicted flap endonuclease-1-like 5' DNA nuclease